MKLKNLKIKNIASIEYADINFEKEPLSDSNVILITGETGAGKSTILDAICLALYATTPRLNTDKGGTWSENPNDKMDVTDTMQLMRKNTQEAYARLSFLGSDGNEYEAEWHVERKTKNLTRTWSLQNLTHREASPGVGTGAGGKTDKEIQQTIQAAVGLTFDQFCRTTMLAQGEFTRFLKSGNKEKAAILEKITNTEQYAQIGAKVYDLTYRKYEKEMDAVDPAKQKQQPLSPGKRAELEEKTSTIGKQLESLNTQLDVAQKKETWLSMEKTLLEKKVEAEKSKTKAEDAMKTGDFKMKQQNVKDWDCTTDARAWLSAVQEATKTIATAEQTLQGLRSTYITVLNGREFILEKIKSIDGKIREIDGEIKAEGGENFSLEELNKQKEAVLTLIGNIATAKVQVDAYFSKMKDRSEKQKTLKELKDEIDKKSKEIDDLKPKVDAAGTDYENSKNEYERLNLAVDTLAEKLRANLQIDHRCPICGQDIKSLDKVPHEEQLKKIVEDAKEKRDKAKGIFDTLNEQYNNRKIWLTQNKLTYEKELKAFNEDKSIDVAKKDALNSLGKCNIKQLDEHSKKALEQAEINANKERTTIEEKIERVNTRDNLQRDLDNLMGEKNNIDPTLKQMSEDVLEWKNITQSKAEELPNILFKIQALTTKVTTALANKETAEDRLKTNQDDLNKYIKDNPNMTVQRLEQLLTLTNVIGQQRQFVANANNALANAQGALKTINGQIEEHNKIKPKIAEGETVESLKVSIEEMKKQIEPLGKESGALEQQQRDDDKLIEMHAALEIEHKKRQTVYERWKKLDKLIGDANGEKFRLIAQSYILANLVNAANVHMRTLTDRYILHSVPGKELIILVEDAYEGGVKRPVSTISGGESFLVSLALALALSEIGQSLKVDTLFIDEGFGTLSGDPLQRAINTLESLRTSNNRQVCVISHRDEVKERIPVQIQVNRAPHSSSSTVDVVVDGVKWNEVS